MRIRSVSRRLAGLWIAFAGGACSPAAPPSADAAHGAVAITHATIVDMTGAPPRSGMTVVAVGGRITAVGPSDSVMPPKQATIVDGTGKYVIPGLWDMHMHSVFDPYERTIVLPLLVANGVTGVRDMAGDCFTACADNDTAYDPLHGPSIDLVHRWQHDIATGTLIGPRMIVGSDMLDGPKPIWPGGLAIHDTAEARAAVRKEQSRGADFIKVYSGLPRAEYMAIADEAKRVGIPFGGHVPDAVSVADAADAGQLSMEHLIKIMDACSSKPTETARGWAEVRSSRTASPAERHALVRRAMTLSNRTFSLAACQPLFERFVRDHTWQVPTLTVLRGSYYAQDSSFRADPRVAYMAKADTAWWMGTVRARAPFFTATDVATAKEYFRHHEEIVGAMHRAGVGVLAGTDVSNPWVYWGFSLHDELAMFVDAGFKPLEALQAATIEPARFLHATDSLGTVAPGKVADLVLLDGDPLADIHNTQRIHAIIVRGQLVDSAARQRLMDGARVAAHKL